MLKYISQFADLTDSLVKLVLQHFDHLTAIFSSWLLDSNDGLSTVLQLSQLITGRVYVVDRTDDLSNLLAVGVLALDLILKVLL